VFEGEPPPPSYPLRSHPRVIATPHVSGATAGSLVTMGVMAAECVVAVLTGAPVPAGWLVT
jgi:phosphoglycerate dehydrogenase-like enzyme